MAIKPAAWLQRLKRYIRGRLTVNAWRHFGRDIRSKEKKLLRNIKQYPDAILVAGCQRSGTTMLARLITGSEGMVNYYFGVDDEHDAALLLCGRVEKPQQGRYCFQTTYLNENYYEYAEINTGFKLIWVVRNPHSVVCSFLYNWESFALNELFNACGKQAAASEVTDISGLSRLEKACYAYVGKTTQALELNNMLNNNVFYVVDYDDMVESKVQLLPDLYAFVDLDYKTAYENRVHSRSLDKSDRLTELERKTIDRICLPAYARVRHLCKNLS